MSTILDALRKIEEENRTRNADARTRLLTTPQRFDLRPPRRQRVSWIVGTGLIMGGITLGAGLMGWGWYAQSPSAPIVATANVPAPRAPTTPAPAPPPAANPASPEPATPVTPSVKPPAPAVAKEEPTVIIVSPSSSPVAAVDLVGTVSTRADGESPVQHSPFVNTAEPERIAPSPPPPLGERRVTTKTKPITKPTPTPQMPTTQEIVTRPDDESPPAPLAEEDVVEETSPAPEEEVAEATSPPTPASVSFLQWSPEPEKRMAFIKVGDKPTALAHEGDIVNGVTVVKIRKEAVELRSGESRWTLKAR